MKTKRTETPKDERIVVRVAKQEADWLKRKAKEEDCSMGRIIRVAIRNFRKAAESFNDADSQSNGLEMAA